MNNRKIILSIAICASLASIASFCMANTNIEASFNSDQWELSWSDEFDYTGLPNPEIWDYEHGYLGFNEELQNYTDSPENARVEDGLLIIEAHLKNVTTQRSEKIVEELEGSNAKVSILGSQEFTSARLITRGKREFVPSLCKAAISIGIAGIFIETHDDPDNAPSDGPNMIKLSNLKKLLEQLQEFDVIAKKNA